MLSPRELVRKLKEVKDDERHGGSAEDDEKEQSDKLQPDKKTLGWERQGPSMEEEKRRKTLNQARYGTSHCYLDFISNVQGSPFAPLWQRVFFLRMAV